MTQIASIYAQLDNIVSQYMENGMLDQLNEDFQSEYFQLRDEIITQLSSLLTSQFNYDESISKQEKKEIAQCISLYFETIELYQEIQNPSLFSIQNKIEDILIDKYMFINGYDKDASGLWKLV